MEIKKITELCTEVRIEDSAEKSKFNFMLISDVHYDNPKCDRKLIHSHLDYALDNNIPVFVFGDFLCLMQGKYDPRRSKKDIRAEHNKPDYLDAVFQDTAEKLSKYAPVLKIFGDGNHETAILKNCEVDPLNNVSRILNDKYGADIIRMGYHGFIRFMFQRNAASVRSSVLYFHHGKFGGAQTKGTLGVGRHGLIAPDADIIVTGHTHDRWYVEQARYRLKQNGEVVNRIQHHVKCGTYKEEYLEAGGFAIERIAQPKSMGGWLMNVQILSSHERNLNISFSNIQ
jgi:hypothetical protein